MTMAEPSRLQELGIDPEAIDPEQRAVLESLTDEEMTLLAGVKRRLEETSDDLEGHMDGGGFCW